MSALPKNCQSKEDGVCRLPINTCQQCKMEIMYSESEVYELINKAIVHYNGLREWEVDPLPNWFDRNKKKIP